MKARPLPEHIARAVTNRGLKLIVNSTEQCNLRCTYCYESFSLKQMPADVINGILRLVQKRAASGLDWLEIEFFGGEPLAAWQVVDTLSMRLHKICMQFGVPLLGAITTNATMLTRPRLDALVQRGFKSFQITLDGPKEIHDRRRVTSTKRGTFDRIWARLQMLKDCPHEVDVLIRLHFDASTVSALADPPNFLEQLATEFLVGDRRFCLQFNPIERWGQPVGADIEFFADHGSKAAALDMLLTRAEEAHILPEQLTQRTGAPVIGESGHIVCYASRSNAFVIRSDGRLAKCTVALEDDRNTIGRILADGELIIDHDRHLPWLRGLISGDAGVLACPAAGLVWPSI
jgi:uncharacterized protein